MKITSRPEPPFPPLAKTHERKTPTDPSRTPAPSVTAEISDEAQQKVLTSTGKNAASPAQRARETLDAYDNLGHLHFGKIVSALARGVEAASTEEPDSDSPPPATPPAGETTDPGTGGTTAEAGPPITGQETTT